MKRRTLIALLTAGAAAAGLTACSALTAFDTLVPKDNGVVRVMSDAAYGADPRQRLDVYRPVSAARDLPIIVFFYGGSWNSGTKSGYSWVGRALAARGFVVAIPDYRLTPAVRFPAFIEDSAAAVQFVIRNAESLGADPERIILAGHSAGAYNAAMLAYDERWLGADHKRVRGFIGLAGPYDFNPVSGPALRAAFAKAGDLGATQPVRFVGPRDPPAFLATAETDRTVEARNSDSLAAKLRAVGVAVTRKRYPGIGHVGLVTAIAKPLRGRAPVLADMIAFAKAVTTVRSGESNPALRRGASASMSPLLHANARP